jgi:hypothetical protein
MGCMIAESFAYFTYKNEVFLAGFYGESLAVILFVPTLRLVLILWYKI